MTQAKRGRPTLTRSLTQQQAARVVQQAQDSINNLRPVLETLRAAYGINDKTVVALEQSINDLIIIVAQHKLTAVRKVTNVS